MCPPCPEMRSGHQRSRELPQLAGNLLIVFAVWRHPRTRPSTTAVDPMIPVRAFQEFVENLSRIRREYAKNLFAQQPLFGREP
jgi:hypothetical protein